MLIERKQSSRSIKSLECSNSRQLKAARQELQTTIGNKDKEIKVTGNYYCLCPYLIDNSRTFFHQRIKSICEGNTSVAIELRVEIGKLCVQLEDSLSSNNIKLREKVNAVTKQSAEQVASLKQTVAQKDRHISEVNDMAIHVANEYNQLKNKTLAQSR